MSTVPITLRDATPPATADAERLVPELARRFHVIDEMWASPGTVVYRCRRRSPDPVVYAVKQSVHVPRADARSLLSQASTWDAPGLLLPEETGSSHDRHWSITPFQMAGSLADRPTGAAPADLEGLLRGLWAALGPLHAEGFAHADLHPGNIVFPDDTWISPRLIDFDLAVRAPARLNRPIDGVPAYQAPEVSAAGRVDRPGDWWAVGMILLEFLTGEHPFGTRAETTDVVEQLHLDGRNLLHAVHDDRWRVALSGLLTREPDLRWGPDQVEAWLEGRRVPATVAAATGPAWHWEGVEVRTIEGLALAVLSTWDGSGDRLANQHARDAFGRWAEANGADPSVIDVLARGPRSNDRAGTDAFLTELLCRLAPGHGPCFAGERFTIAELAAKAQLGVLRGEAGAAPRGFVDRLHTSGSLRILAGLPHAELLAPVAESFDRAWHDTTKAVREAASSIGGVSKGQRRDLVVSAGCAVLGTLLDPSWSTYWARTQSKIDRTTSARTPWFATFLETPLHPSAKALLTGRLQEAARTEALDR